MRVIGSIILIAVLCFQNVDMANSRKVKRSNVMSAEAYKRRLRKYQMPGATDIRIAYTMPENSTWPDNMFVGTIENTIYSPYGRLDRADTAHEAFHVLQRSFSDADRAVLLKRVGQPGGDWYGTGRSPQEVAANWYSAIIQGIDPGRVWEGSYYTPNPPKRRELLRFARTLDKLRQKYNLPVYTRPR